MRDLEERCVTESLSEIGSQTGECIVGEQHFALDLTSNILDSPRVRKTQCRPSLGEGCVCVCQGGGEGVVREEAQRAFLFQRN